MNDEYQRKLEKAISDKKKNKNFLGRLQQLKPSYLDRAFHEEHFSVFEKIDCLSCANCCKTTSPIFRDVDIERISQHLKLKPARFTEKYLKMDRDGDYILISSPCTFLNNDNTCSIYNYRPKACREYPHTDRKNMHQILNLTRKNTEICPAVSEIVNRLRAQLH